MTLAVVVTTVATQEDARRVAGLLVEERLAACVQVLRCESVYVWEGIKREPELRLEAKTLEAAVPQLMARLAAIHPYDEPEIIVLPVQGASDGYRRFVEENVQAG
jgi:periplasmic divalent cation tolerance protein